MAELTALPRKFRYTHMLLDDLDSAATPDEIRQFYSEVYTALISADIEGPVIEDGAEVYTFKLKIGQKGVASKKKSKKGNKGSMSSLDTTLMKVLSECVSSTNAGDIEVPPSEVLEAL